MAKIGANSEFAYLDRMKNQRNSIWRKVSKTLLKRQEEMERKFNVYLQATKLKTVQSSKRKNSNPDEDRNKWLTF